MSLIDGNNIIAILGIVLGLTFGGLYAEQHRYLNKVPGVVWILVPGLLLSNLGIIPMKSPVYDFVGAHLVPLAIPLLLYKASLRNILREGGKVLPIFLLGSITVCIGAIVGYALLDLGPIGPKVAATYVAGWIGGMTDFVALAQITEMTPAEFSVALSASAPVSILGLLALAALPAVPWLSLHLPYTHPHEQAAQPAALILVLSPIPFRATHLMGALSLSAVLCGLADQLAQWLRITSFSMFIVSLLAVLAANIAPKQLGRLQGDFDLGMLLMYLFFACVGAGTDAVGFVTAAPKLFVFGVLIIVIHLVLLLAIAKVLRFALDEVVIGSGANIVGAAAAAGVASSKGWVRLVTPAITAGMLGKAIANFFGIFLYRMLS